MYRFGLERAKTEGEIEYGDLNWERARTGFIFIEEDKIECKDPNQEGLELVHT
ncbi:hypothetical protein C2G38_2198094 [Gigaspora rosea]|uniref:Uncharacterized protein n=1 Tax=Gigaspora rosea TaxID=44941 RepID=A0A397UU64_9GLOM|nr:hypothetical protein C2G38_2198094 [Gigaspora rosea]